MPLNRCNDKDTYEHFDNRAIDRELNSYKRERFEPMNLEQPMAAKQLLDLTQERWAVGNRRTDKKNGGEFRVMRDQEGGWMGDVRDSNSKDTQRIAVMLQAPQLLSICKAVVADLGSAEWGSDKDAAAILQEIIDTHYPKIREVVSKAEAAA